MENKQEMGRDGGGGVEGGQPGLNKAEGRVVDRLLRAKLVAALGAPGLVPTLDELISLAEMIEDEGG